MQQKLEYDLPTKTTTWLWPFILGICKRAHRDAAAGAEGSDSFKIFLCGLVWNNKNCGIGVTQLVVLIDESDSPLTIGYTLTTRTENQLTIFSKSTLCFILCHYIRIILFASEWWVWEGWTRAARLFLHYHKPWHLVLTCLLYSSMAS